MAARILVVDDEESIRTFADAALRAAGFETMLAVSGADALARAEHLGDFDLLLTDMRMPGMDGCELARRLRQSRPDLPVLYLTGFSDALFDEKATLWENEAFLEKPTSVKGLIESVSMLLAGSRLA
jgi:two-component system cell cycle sensor histidine kinase/response regulator CckA